MALLLALSKMTMLEKAKDHEGEMEERTKEITKVT